MCKKATRVSWRREGKGVGIVCKKCGKDIEAKKIEKEEVKKEPAKDKATKKEIKKTVKKSVKKTTKK